MTIEKLKKDIKLVRECIVHWDRVIQGVDKPNAQSCSLCQEYLNNAGEGSCMKCPIYRETGKTGCRGTPYHEALIESVGAASSVTKRTHMRNFLWELEKKLQQKLYEARKHRFIEKPGTRISKLDKDIRLLDECIIHWHAVLKGEEEPSGSKCALYREYSKLSSCDGCPIQESTGVSSCRGTPYYNARWEITFLQELQAQLMKKGALYKTELQPKLTKPSIDWKAVAPQYKYLARDAGGKAFLYTKTPYVSHAVWLCTGVPEIASANAFASYKPGNCDWKDSLVERPEEQRDELLFAVQ